MTSQKLTVFPGPVLEKNEQVIDWGTHRLLAYAVNSYVVVVDTVSMQVIQTLDDHSTPVTALHWAPQRYSNNNDAKPLLLATGDQSGMILVWNVAEGSIHMSFNAGTLP